jgi:hypothetical protein
MAPEARDAIAIATIWLLMQLLKLIKRKFGDRVPIIKDIEEDKLKKLIPIISLLLAGGGYAAGALDDPHSAVAVGGLAVAANEVGKATGRLVRSIVGGPDDQQ